MSKSIKLRKGLDIRIKGHAEKILETPAFPSFFGIRPTDFHGLVPKLSVKEGDIVKAGDPLFFDKNRPEILFTSPVSGSVSAINRGERRRQHSTVKRPSSLKTVRVCYQRIVKFKDCQSTVRELSTEGG